MVSRREILGLVSAGLSIPLAPLALSQSAARSGRRLILVELSGANDGLNTLVPAWDDRYHGLRPEIGLGPSEVVELESQLGLNSAMTPLMEAWQDGELAVVQGLGYPSQNRSHFKSIALWETGGDGNRAERNGWLTEDIEAMGGGPFDAHGISLDGGMGVFASSTGLWISLTSLADVQTLSATNANYQNAVGAADNPALSMLVDRANSFDTAMSHIAAKIERLPNRSFRINARDLGRQASLAAQLIVAGVNAPVLKLKISGFDTHEDQRGDHERLLATVASALSGLRRVLKRTGHWDDTLVMTYSEFGRRARENESGGTDHGSAAPHFILGGRVKGGLWGSHPDLGALDGDDLQFTMDYRSVYDRVLSDWFNLPNNRFRSFVKPELNGIFA